MYILGYCCEFETLELQSMLEVAKWIQKVIYQSGVNEKLLGDFIRKHNVRDKVFS